MTNEEKKSNEIAAEYLMGHDRFEITYEEMREAVMTMAEWKDAQFKEYLEKKKAEIEHLEESNMNLNITKTLTTDWEQVRIQAAIAAMQGMCCQNMNYAYEIYAKRAVNIADALIEELKKEK